MRFKHTFYLKNRKEPLIIHADSHTDLHFEVAKYSEYIVLGIHRTFTLNNEVSGVIEDMSLVEAHSKEIEDEI